MSSYTKITFSDRLSKEFGTINYLAEGVLDIFGTARKVSVLNGELNGFKLKSYGCRLTVKENDQKQGWKLTALKIALWVGSAFLIPALALAWKVGTRLYYKYIKIKPFSPPYSTPRYQSVFEYHNKQVERKKYLDSNAIEKLNSQSITLRDLGYKSLKDAMPFLNKHKGELTRLDLTPYVYKIRDYYEGDYFAPRFCPSSHYYKYCTDPSLHPSDEEIADIISLNPNLKYVKISSENISDKTLTNLSKLPKLETLILRSCTKITGEGLSELAMSGSLFESLVTLELEDVKNLTDKGLKHLSKLPKLKTLTLRGCTKITGEGLSELAMSGSLFESLVCLKLYDLKNLTDKGLKNLSKLPKLKELFLRSCTKITGEGLSELAMSGSLFESLVHLHLDYLKNLTDKGLKNLSKLPKLKTLTLDQLDEITDVGLKDLSTLPKLESLWIESCTKIKGLKGLSHFKNLREVSLKGNFTNKGLKELSKLKKLEFLWVEFSASDSRFCPWIKDLAKLPNLRSLSLYGDLYIDDASIKQINGIKNLQSLHIDCDYDGIDFEGWASIWHSNLTHLWVGRSRYLLREKPEELRFQDAENAAYDITGMKKNKIGFFNFSNPANDF